VILIPGVLMTAYYEVYHPNRGHTLFRIKTNVPRDLGPLWAFGCPEGGYNVDN